MFKNYYTQSTPGMYGVGGVPSTPSISSSLERYILQKEDGELVRTEDKDFLEDMVDYFNDCPTLVQKIKNKDFRDYDIKLIVNFYNESCK